MPEIQNPPPKNKSALKRSLSLPLLTLYGLGTTVGAGIYVLVGEVAAEAGLFAPVSFLIASAIIALTAFSFGELSSRYPKSAGEAVYVNEGLGLPGLAVAVGFLVVFSGLLSSAAMANGFVGYANELIELPRWLAIVLVVMLLGAVAAIGISQSVIIAAAITVIEVCGLIVVLWVARDAFADLPARLPDLLPSLDGVAWGMILAGSMLAFFAFIGFEDMVNVAEEVKSVRRTLPLAIILTLGITTILYMMIAVVAVLSLPIDVLSGAKAPLALIYSQATGSGSTVISLVAIVAVLNGALIQIIMASRVLYGLGAEGWLPPIVAAVHPRTQTPLIATGIAVAIVLALALLLPLVTLALTTSMMIVIVYAIVNLALWRVKIRDPKPTGAVIYPVWVPISGFFVNIAFFAFQLSHWLVG